MRKAFAYIAFLSVSVSLHAQADAHVSGHPLPGKVIQMEGAFDTIFNESREVVSDKIEAICISYSVNAFLRA